MRAKHELWSYMLARTATVRTATCCYQHARLTGCVSSNVVSSAVSILFHSILLYTCNERCLVDMTVALEILLWRSLFISHRHHLLLPLPLIQAGWVSPTPPTPLIRCDSLTLMPTLLRALLALVLLSVVMVVTGLITTVATAATTVSQLLSL